jgi:hypothetical protein
MVPTAISHGRESTAIHLRNPSDVKHFVEYIIDLFRSREIVASKETYCYWCIAAISKIIVWLRQILLFVQVWSLFAETPYSVSQRTLLNEDAALCCSRRTNERNFAYTGCNFVSLFSLHTHFCSQEDTEFHSWMEGSFPFIKRKSNPPFFYVSSLLSLRVTLKSVLNFSNYF